MEHDPAIDPQEYAMRSVARRWGNGESVDLDDLSELSTYLGFEVQDRDLIIRQMFDPKFRPF